MERIVKIVSIGHGDVVIAADALTDCARCAEGNGCGGAMFAKIFGRKNISLVVPSSHKFAIGENAILRIDDAFIIRSSAWLYLMPLIVMMFFGLVTSLFTQREFLIACSSVVGLIVGFFLVRHCSLSYHAHVSLEPKNDAFRCSLTTS